MMIVIVIVIVMMIIVMMIEAYVEARPHIIVTLLRRFEGLVRIMNSARTANNFSNDELPAFVPLVFRYIRNNSIEVNVAVAADNAIVQGNNLIAQGLNQIQANVAVNFSRSSCFILPCSHKR